MITGRDIFQSKNMNILEAELVPSLKVYFFVFSLRLNLSMNNASNKTLSMLLFY